MKNTVYYKLVRSDYRSFYDDTFQWPVRGIVEVSNAEPDGACGRGLHLAKSITDGLRYARFPFRILGVIPRSPVLGEDDTKIRVARAETLGECRRPKWFKITERRIANLPAEMKAIPWFKGTDDRCAMTLLRSHFKLLVPFGFKLDWEIEVVHTQEEADAARAAARAAAWDAARAAAWDAARAAARDAAWDAARDAAWDAAWDAARDVAWDAARAAARDAAWDAAWDVAWDAGKKLPPNPFRPLWEVWKMGAWPIGLVGKTFKVYVAKKERT